MKFSTLFFSLLVFVKLVLFIASNNHNGVGIYCSDTYCNQMVISETNIEFDDKISPILLRRPVQESKFISSISLHDSLSIVCYYTDLDYKARCSTIVLHAESTLSSSSSPSPSNNIDIGTELIKGYEIVYPVIDSADSTTKFVHEMTLTKIDDDTAFLCFLIEDTVYDAHKNISCNSLSTSGTVISESRSEDFLVHESANSINIELINSHHNSHYVLLTNSWFDSGEDRLNATIIELDAHNINIMKCIHTWPVWDNNRFVANYSISSFHDGRFVICAHLSDQDGQELQCKNLKYTIEGFDETSIDTPGKHMPVSGTNKYVQLSMTKFSENSTLLCHSNSTGDVKTRVSFCKEIFYYENDENHYPRDRIMLNVSEYGLSRVTGLVTIADNQSAIICYTTVCHLIVRGANTTIDYASTSLVNSIAKISNHLPCRAGFRETTTVNDGIFKCAGCARGTYKNFDGHGNCTQCPRGTYQNMEGQTACIPCMAGTYSKFPGENVGCTLCEQGTHQPDIGSSACLACPDGQQNTPLHHFCENCPAGKFSNITFGSCMTCPDGLFSPSNGMRECNICPGGFESNSAYTSCVTCQAGKFRDPILVNKCTPCSPGLYSPNDGSSQCIHTPAGYYTSIPGMSSYTPCPVGTYAPTEGSAICLECDRGFFNRDLYGREGSHHCPLGTALPMRIGYGLLIAIVAVYTLIFFSSVYPMPTVIEDNTYAYVKLLLATGLGTLDHMSSLLYFLLIPFTNYELYYASFCALLSTFVCFIHYLYYKGANPKASICAYPRFATSETYDNPISGYCMILFYIPYLIMNSPVLLPTFIVGYVGYLTKFLSFAHILNPWLYFYTGGKYSFCKLRVDANTLNHSILSQSLLQSFPQLIIQIINTYNLEIPIRKWEWPTVVSLVTCFLMTLNGLYVLIYHKVIYGNNVLDARTGLEDLEEEDRLIHVMSVRERRFQKSFDTGNIELSDVHVSMNPVLQKGKSKKNKSEFNKYLEDGNDNDDDDSDNKPPWQRWRSKNIHDDMNEMMQLHQIQASELDATKSLLNKTRKALSKLKQDQQQRDALLHQQFDELLRQQQQQS